MNNEMKLVPCKLCGKIPVYLHTGLITCNNGNCSNRGVVSDFAGAAWNRLNAPAPAQAEPRAVRRERIAVALFSRTDACSIVTCIDCADAMMAELDRRAALDAESAKGGAS